MRARRRADSRLPHLRRRRSCGAAVFRVSIRLLRRRRLKASAGRPAALGRAGTSNPAAMDCTFAGARRTAAGGEYRAGRGDAPRRVAAGQCRRLRRTWTIHGGLGHGHRRSADGPPSRSLEPRPAPFAPGWRGRHPVRARTASSLPPALLPAAARVPSRTPAGPCRAGRSARWGADPGPPRAARTNIGAPCFASRRDPRFFTSCCCQCRHRLPIGKHAHNFSVAAVARL